MKNKLVIFEGPDCSGKTTVARRMAKHLDAVNIHHTSYNGVHGDPLMERYATSMGLSVHVPVVLDRCWLSEVPYGQVFRGGLDRLGPDRVQSLEKWANYLGAKVVLCLPPWNNVRDTFLLRQSEEMLTGMDQIKKVYGLYTNMKTTVPLIHYNYTTDNFEDLLKCLNFQEL